MRESCTSPVRRWPWALLAAPLSPPHNRPAGISRKARQARSSKKRGAGHQPDRSGGDGHRPRLSRRHAPSTFRSPFRRAARMTPAGQPGARPRHRRERRPWSTPAPAASRSTSSGRCGNGRRGGHSAGGVEAPQTDVVLAEGATGNFFSTFILLVNPNAERGVGDGAPAERRRARRPTSPTARRQQPADHPGQQPAEVPQRQLRAPCVTASQPVFVEARDMLARLRGRPRCDRRLEPVVDVALRRGLHRRRLRDLLPARQHRRRRRSRRRCSFFRDNRRVVAKTVSIAASSRPHGTASATTPTARLTAFATPRSRRSAPIARRAGDV